MAEYRKSNGQAASMPEGLITGVAVSVGWSILCVMITSALVISEKITYEALGYCVLTIIITASYVAAEIACMRIKRRKLIVSGCAGGIYFIVLLIINALFFGGQYTGVGATALAVLGGTGSSVLLRLRREGKGNKVKYKKQRV